jgi:hypothetical protein
MSNDPILAVIEEHKAHPQSVEENRTRYGRPRFAARRTAADWDATG